MPVTGAPSRPRRLSLSPQPDRTRSRRRAASSSSTTAAGVNRARFTCRYTTARGSRRLLRARLPSAPRHAPAPLRRRFSSGRHAVGRAALKSLGPSPDKIGWMTSEQVAAKLTNPTTVSWLLGTEPITQRRLSPRRPILPSRVESAIRAFSRWGLHGRDQCLERCTQRRHPRLQHRCGCFPSKNVDDQTDLVII